MEHSRPEDLAMFEQTAERFAREVVARAPTALDVPNGAERRRVIDAAVELGLLSLAAPESAGGLGQDVDALCAVLRPIAREDAGVASLLLVQAVGQRALAGVWPEAVQATDLLTWALFADVYETSCVHVRADGCVEGSLGLVPLADVASYLLCDARDDEGGTQLVCVSLRERGVERAPAPVLGLSCIAPFDLSMTRVGVRTTMRNALSTPELRAWGALGVAAIALGILEGTLRTALDYARQRRQGGRLIIEWPEVRRMLGDIHASEVLVASALAGVLARRTLDDAAALLALDATERASAATTDGVQLLGGNGYTKDYPQERRMRDARQLRAVYGAPRTRGGAVCDAWLGAA